MFVALSLYGVDVRDGDYASYSAKPTQPSFVFACDLSEFEKFYGTKLLVENIIEKAQEEVPEATFSLEWKDRYRIIVKVPRTRSFTPASWSSHEIGDQERQEMLRKILDTYNRLIQSLWSNSLAVAQEAIAAKTGQPVFSPYTVVLTYKGVVLEAVPVTTLQQANDAMTLMQENLRIKTVKGSSKQGARANRRY